MRNDDLVVRVQHIRESGDRPVSSPIALVVLAVPGAAWAGAQVYVDVASTASFPTGTQEAPFPTIQQGINAAAAGDVVQVAAGTYNESLIMRDGVSVVGAGPDVTILDASGTRRPRA